MQEKNKKNFEDELLRPLSKERLKILGQEVLESRKLQSTFLTIIKESKGKLACNSSYALSLIDDICPQFAQKNIYTIIEKTICSNNNSELRNLLRTLIKKTIPEESASNLLNKCYDILLKPNIPVAVLANAISVLYVISNIEPELKRELIFTLENFLQNESPAIKNRARKITAQLKNELRK